MSEFRLWRSHRQRHLHRRDQGSSVEFSVEHDVTVLSILVSINKSAEFDIPVHLQAYFEGFERPQDQGDRSLDQEGGVGSYSLT